MNKRITLVTLIFLFCFSSPILLFGRNNVIYEEWFLDLEEHRIKNINLINTTVFVCTGPYAYAYHSRSDCAGLGNCKGEIRYTDQYTAENYLGRVPCCRCWSNVAGRCKDDNPYYSPGIKFNPYVPQIPAIAYDPEYIAAVAEKKRREQEQAAEAIGALLEYIFTPTLEGIARRTERREIRESKREGRRIEKAMRPYEKYKNKKLPSPKKNMLNSRFTVTYFVRFPGAVNNSPNEQNEIAFWAEDTKGNNQEEIIVNIPNGVTLWTKSYTAKAISRPYKLGIRTINPIYVNTKGAIEISVYINNVLCKKTSLEVNDEYEASPFIYEALEAFYK